MAYALIDPAGARAKGVALRNEFATAKMVHVLSTRFARDKQLWKDLGTEAEDTCEPRSAAAIIKEVLEADDRSNSSASRKRHKVARKVSAAGQGSAVTTSAGLVRVFNPNTDNALLMEGDSASANAIWLLNWRQVGLENARRTGGVCLQILVPPGLSKMQIAEESMARDSGVPIVRIDCTRILSELTMEQAMMMPEVKALLLQQAQVRRGGTRDIPPTRGELDDFVRQEGLLDRFHEWQSNQ